MSTRKLLYGVALVVVILLSILVVFRPPHVSNRTLTHSQLPPHPKRITRDDTNPPHITDYSPEPETNENWYFQAVVVDDEGGLTSVYIYFKFYVNGTWSASENHTMINVCGNDFCYTTITPWSATSALYVISAFDVPGNWNNTNSTVDVIDGICPISVAPDDRTVNEDVEVSLDDTNSTDNIGVVSWEWQFEEDEVVTSEYGQHTSHIFNTPGIYNIQLIVYDDENLIGQDDFDITVSDLTPPNIVDSSINLPDTGEEFTFRATFTDNGNREDLYADYRWRYTNGSVGERYNETMSYFEDDDWICTVDVPDNATYLFWNYTGCDSSGNWNYAEYSWYVRDIIPPDSNAGGNQIVNQGTMVYLYSDNTTDNIGVTNISWTFSYNGSTILLYEDPIGSEVSYWFYTPGLYVVNMIAIDAEYNDFNDMMTVTVVDIIPPEADAGDNVTADEDRLVTFDPSGSTDNVGITSWRWNWTVSSTNYVLNSRNTYTFINPGYYVVTLTVYDAAGLSDTDIVYVTILPVEDDEDDRSEEDNYTENITVGNIVYSIGNMSSQIVELESGWNLISLFIFNLTSDDIFEFDYVDSIAFRSEDGSYTILLAITTGRDTINLTGIGFYVYASTATEMELGGREILHINYTLETGWHIIMVPDGYSLNATNVLDDNVSAVVSRFDDGSYQFYIMGFSRDELVLESGRGYFIFVVEETTRFL